MQTILIVDDESQIRSALQGVLEDEGYKTLLAGSGEECMDTLRHKSVDVVLLDIWLPGIDGLETLEKLVEIEDHPEVIMISGHGNIETAVRATKLGAFDFLEKPLSIERTLIVLKNAIEAKRLRSENLEYKKQFQARSVIVGNSIPMKALRQQIALMAPTNGRVLIYGESGTGKELASRAIHAQSLRKDAMFVEVNCAAIPEDLIESELFGHRKGAFSGAAVDKVLRTLDEGRFAPVGEEEPITVDARVIAATNKDLEEEISKGNFREDLFYRLNVIPFYVPPLRERKEDIPLLARYFLKEFSQAYDRRPKEIADEALDVLMRYSWPGNVRELRNLIERIVIMNPTVVKLERKHLPTLVYRESGRRSVGDFSSLPAEVLGLERSHMYRKMKALGIAVKE